MCFTSGISETKEWCLMGRSSKLSFGKILLESLRSIERNEKERGRKQ